MQPFPSLAPVAAEPAQDRMSHLLTTDWILNQVFSQFGDKTISKLSN